MEKEPKIYNIVITKELEGEIWFVLQAKFMTEVEIAPILEALENQKEAKRPPFGTS